MKANPLGYTAADYNRRTPPPVIRPALAVLAGSATLTYILVEAIRLIW